MSTDRSISPGRHHVRRTAAAAAALLAMGLAGASIAAADDDDDDDDDGSPSHSAIAGWPPTEVAWPPQLASTDQSARRTGESTPSTPIVMPHGQSILATATPSPSQASAPSPSPPTPIIPAG